MFKRLSLLLIIATLVLLSACGEAPVAPTEAASSSAPASSVAAPASSEAAPSSSEASVASSESVASSSSSAPAESSSASVESSSSSSVSSEVASSSEASSSAEAAAASSESSQASAPAQTAELNVFAAASLTESFKDIGKAFEAQNSGVKVVLNFAGSQQLAQQLAQGAPGDVFASASKKQMTPVIEAGRIVSGTQKVFVRNQLVVIYPKSNPAGMASLNDLAKPGLKLVLADKAVPVGQYALDILDKMEKDAAYGSGFKDSVLKNVVSYEDNVKSVLSKVVLGEADAGVVYTTDITQDAKDKVVVIEIPANLNVIASYPIAAISDAKNPELAQKFIELVLSKEGQTILNNYGFMSPETK
jgi:molybdate transport system substrate-binding protein